MTPEQELQISTLVEEIKPHLEAIVAKVEEAPHADDKPPWRTVLFTLLGFAHGFAQANDLDEEGVCQIVRDIAANVRRKDA